MPKWPLMPLILLSTKRGKKDNKEILMCGVPVHAADVYLARLIRKGFKVAVCEQVEKPEEARKKR